MNHFYRQAATILMILLLAGCNREHQQPAFEFNISNPTESGSQYPHLYRDASGYITMSWILKIEEDLNSIQFSTYRDGRWTQIRTVRNSSDFFVNWADFPSVVSQDGEIVAAHWLNKKSGGPYAYDVNITFPGDQPRRWTDPLTPHTDETATEHGFVSMEPIGEDKVLAVWLDGRNTENRADDEYNDPEQAMTLRSAEISSDGTVDREHEIDAMVCDCCPTDLVAMDGNVVVVYRNRTEDEIRDIYSASYNLESGEWSEPTAVSEDGWQISGCPVNGPSIDANNGVLAVSWYTEADGRKTVKTAVSSDGGESFTEPEIVAEENTVGRTDVVVGDDGTVYTSWMSSREDRGYVMLRTLSPDSNLGEPIRVGITTSTRRSGFPQMVRSGDGLMFAWTQTDPLIRVRTAVVRYDQIEQMNTPDS